MIDWLIDWLIRAGKRKDISSVRSGSRIHRTASLLRGKTHHTHQISTTKSYDVDALIQSIWGVLNTHYFYYSKIDSDSELLYPLGSHLLVKVKYFIILSCHQHGYPWPSLATPPYRSSLLEGPQGYILYPHWATVCRLELVAILLLGHVRGSIGEHHLWARVCFSSSVLHVWFD